MKILDPGKKPLLCQGFGPYEPLTYPSGTLSDGTTYTFTATAGATVTDLGQGTIDFGDNDPTLTVTFSAPVDGRFTSAVATIGRGVWHGVASGARGTRATTNGSAWCLDEGTVLTNMQLDGQVAQSFDTQPAVSANQDWGSLESFNTTEISIRSYVWDAYNFEARPKVKSEQPVCDVVDDMCNQLKSALVVPEMKQYELCTGPFENCNLRSSWLQTWTPVGTANLPITTYIDWRTIGNGVRTSPDCETDMTINANLGSHYIRANRIRAYIWFDYRLLVNGIAVVTRTNEVYRYIDGLNDTNPDVIPPIPQNIEPFGNITDHRLSVPPSSTVEAQVRVRYQLANAQSSPYFRMILGLRSQTNFSFSPKQIITEVV